jgi:hypothetical protein
MSISTNIVNNPFRDRDSKGRFKCGNLRGLAALRYISVGTVVIRYIKPKAGKTSKGHCYRFIKIRDDGPSQKRFMYYARYLFIKEYGSVPPGYFVIHKDGNTLNDTIENLILLQRKQWINIGVNNNPRNSRRRNRGVVKAVKKRAKDARNIKDSKSSYWECKCCGYYMGRKPFQCPKCTGGAYIKIERSVN